MGTMTGAQLESEIRANLGNRTDLDSRLYIFLNWAQEEVARRIYLRELETLDTSKSTVADQDYIAKPTGIRDLISFRLIDGTNSRKLIWIPRRRYDELFAKPDAHASARPELFTAWGTNYYFFRIPDAIYALRFAYTKWPTALTTQSASVSDIEYLDELLVVLGTIKAMRSLKDVDPNELIAYKNDAAKIIGDAVSYDKGLQVDEEIKPMYEYKTGHGEYWLDPFIKRNP